MENPRSSALKQGNTGSTRSLRPRANRACGSQKTIKTPLNSEERRSGEGFEAIVTDIYGTQQGITTHLKNRSEIEASERANQLSSTPKKPLLQRIGPFQEKSLTDNSRQSLEPETTNPETPRKPTIHPAGTRILRTRNGRREVPIVNTTEVEDSSGRTIRTPDRSMAPSPRSLVGGLDGSMTIISYREGTLRPEDSISQCFDPSDDSD